MIQITCYELFWTTVRIWIKETYFYLSGIQMVIRYSDHHLRILVQNSNGIHTPDHLAMGQLSTSPVFRSLCIFGTKLYIFCLPRKHNFKIEGVNVCHDFGVVTKSVAHDAYRRYFIDIVYRVVERRFVAKILWSDTSTATIWGVVKTRPALGCYIHFQQSTKSVIYSRSKMTSHKFGTFLITYMSQ